MSRKDEILEHLKRDETDNINMINFIEGYPIHHMERVGGSVFIRGRSDRDWVYISSKSGEELEIIKEKLGDGDKNFAIMEDWMLPILFWGKTIDWRLSTLRLILPDEIELMEPVRGVSELSIEDSGFIYESSDYKEYLSIEYIRERIENGLSSCIYMEGKPIAWGITQDDGAIGFLHVLPEHRGKGYAKDVMLDLIRKVRSRGKIPFVHVEEENKESMGLCLGLGFERDRTVHWIGLE